jgi:hypothetical protein
MQFMKYFKKLFNVVKSLTIIGSFIQFSPLAAQSTVELPGVAESRISPSNRTRVRLRTLSGNQVPDALSPKSGEVYSTRLIEVGHYTGHQELVITKSVVSLRITGLAAKDLFDMLAETNPSVIAPDLTVAREIVSDGAKNCSRIRTGHPDGDTYDCTVTLKSQVHQQSPSDGTGQQPGVGVGN